MKPSSPFDLVALPRRSRALAIVVTLVGVAAAALLTRVLTPYTNETVFLVPFMAVALAAAWYGGVAVGFVAIALSFLVNEYYFAEPFHSFAMGVDDMVRLLVFAALAVLLVVLVDARNRAVALQHQQRQWLLVTMASAGDAMVVTDDHGRVLFLNRVAEDLLQWRSGEAEGRRLQEVFHIANEQTREPVADPVDRVLQTGAIVGLANHTILIARDGREIPIDDSAAPVKDDEGITRGVVLLFRDVSGRRRLERSLAEQAERLRERAMLVEQAHDAIFVRDLDGRIVFWNHAAEELYGWQRDEVLGRSPHEVLQTDFGQPVDAVERTLREAGVWNGEIRHTTREGRRLIIESRHVLVRDESGNGRVILEINRDITRRRNAEEERERALQEAREANRLKDDFLTTLSHELRTPLNAILGWSQILLQSSLDDETTQRALRTIARNAEAQSQLIADVLDVSRIVSGKMRLAIEPVELTTLAIEALDSVRPAAEAKGLVLRKEVEPGAVWVSADRDRVQQILWNLLTNAVKFTPRGGEIRLDVARVDSRVRVRVTDTGLGITPEFLPHVFERFAQHDSSSTRVHGGLGLGLAIVRHLAEAHGGTVSAESAGQNAGATFTVLLPVRAVSEPVENWAVPQLGAASRTVDAMALTGFKVLVVDDEADARDLIREVLRRYGAVVTTADSVTSALEELRRERFDLLVADIGMPGEDGYSLIRKVRHLAPTEGRDVMAMAVTAYGRPEDRVRALAAGYQQHLAKPVVPGELVIVAASLLNRRSELPTES